MVTGWYLNQRLFVVKILMVFAFLALSGVFFQVQVLTGSRYLTLSQDNRIRRVWIPAPRGKILDRNGVVMVDNRPSFDVSLDYKALKEREPSVNLLAKALHLSKEEINGILDHYRGPAYLSIPIAKDVDMQTLIRVEEARRDMPLVNVEVNPVRKYILGEKACSILGYVGAINKEQYQKLKDRGYHFLDVLGKAGLEAACEAFLKGVSGGMQLEVDHRGHREQILNILKPVSGRDVYLTIDMKIQEALEQVLEGKIGAGIVMNPNTGEVLAVVNKPSYDPNIFIKPDLRQKAVELFKDSGKPLINKAFQGVYGPGSIFKVIVAAAGLDTGIIDESTGVNCPGSYQVGGKIFRCWKNIGHGQMDVVSAIKHSCNVFFYTMGQKIGPDRIAEYSKKFGLGSLTGLDIGMEKNGIVPSPKWKKERLREGWYGGDTANYSIGQGFVTVTPLQMAKMVSAIANGGELLAPYIIKKVVLPEGRTLIEMAPKRQGSVHVPVWILNKIKKGMYAVVNEQGGTGRLSRLDHVEVCGKTGTVQVKRGADFTKNGWFVAFAPYQKPEIVLVLIVEGVHSGGQDVAPLAKVVLERCFSR